MGAFILVCFSILLAVVAPFSAWGTLFLLPIVVIALWKRVPQGVLGWLMLGWLIWLPLSLTVSLSPGLSLSHVAVLLCLPLGWLTGLYLQERGRLVTLLEYGLPLLLLVLLVWGVLQGPNTASAKPQGPFNDSNTYAALLNLLFLPVLARYMAVDLSSRPIWWRAAQLVLMAGTAFVLFLTASRGATLSLLILLPFVLWLARSEPGYARKLVLLTIVTVVAYVAVLIATEGTSSVAVRLAGIAEKGDPSRLMLFQSAWSMIQAQPWLGTGLGTFRLLYPQYRYPDEIGTAGGWVHNDYLQGWLEAGLPMLLLMLGVFAWVSWGISRAVREGGPSALLRMGYLAGIGVILLQAFVNFLFFFALVGLLVGLYLAHLAVGGETERSVPKEKVRSVRLIASGYALILGWLFVGQVAVEGLLVEYRSIQRGMMKLGMIYPHYEVAYWVSVLAPFHPMPQQVMGLGLADAYGITGGGDHTMRNAALSRMEAARQRAPCYLPYANDALALIRPSVADESLRKLGESIVASNIECNARHGLTYYNAGELALPRSESEALEWWRAGLAATPGLGDRLLLATVILSRSTPGHEKELVKLAGEMETSLRTLEANPDTPPDRAFWDGVQHKLWRIAGNRLLELVPPPSSQ